MRGCEQTPLDEAGFLLCQKSWYCPSFSLMNTAQNTCMLYLSEYGILDVGNLQAEMAVFPGNTRPN